MASQLMQQEMYTLLTPSTMQSKNGRLQITAFERLYHLAYTFQAVWRWMAQAAYILPTLGIMWSKNGPLRPILLVRWRLRDWSNQMLWLSMAQEMFTLLTPAITRSKNCRMFSSIQLPERKDWQPARMSCQSSCQPQPIYCHRSRQRAISRGSPSLASQT